MIKQQLIGAAVALLIIALSLHVYAAEFIPLGDFPEGNSLSIASAISDDGATVVGAGSRFESFVDWSDALLWKPETGIVNLQPLPLSDSPRTFAQSVSGNGSAVAGVIRYYGYPQSSEAFRWTAADGIVGLGYLPGAPAYTSGASDISRDGGVIVGNSDSVNGPYEAFRWTDESGMVGLGDLPGGSFASLAYGVSANGEVIVGSATSENGGEAFRWTSTTGMIALNGTSSGFSGNTAYGISSDGTAIVGSGFSKSSGTTVEAFRWTEDQGMQPLGDLPGGYFLSEAYSASSNGSVVVGTSDRADGGKAFVWDQLHGIRDLQEVLIEEFSLGSQLADWTMTVANDISDDGLSIAGTGINPDGNTEAWLVRLDRPLTAPEPNSLALLLLGGSILANKRRRTRQS